MRLHPTGCIRAGRAGDEVDVADSGEGVKRYGHPFGRVLVGEFSGQRWLDESVTKALLDEHRRLDRQLLGIDEPRECGVGGRGAEPGRIQSARGDAAERVCGGELQQALAKQLRVERLGGRAEGLARENSAGSMAANTGIPRASSTLSSGDGFVACS